MVNTDQDYTRRLCEALESVSKAVNGLTDCDKAYLAGRLEAMGNAVHTPSDPEAGRHADY